ncbi:acyl-CoA dehydrogenase family protein [Ilumatobacter sp.]|uniref:acyl-CoA dehydrogenase family protein n=1 Tax=Ilumatobacter sp. TaxID=1967498 RepID=UPI003B53046D
MATSDPVRTEIDEWLATNWDPDLSVGEWWERLGLAGWSAPTLPTNAYGHDLSRGDAVTVHDAIAEHGALPAPGGLGLLLAAPTIAAHGTDDQVERYVRDIVTGQRAWCQLFSEPGAGSDLAGLQARAERDGEEWVVNGQKVWTSSGHVADLGMLIARTDPDAPKHRGISYFAIDMHQPGIDIRPLREMTGRALFNEVFLTDATTGADTIIGDANNGWAVANATLAFERSGLGSGGGSSARSAALPGTVAGHLERRAGDFVPDDERRASSKRTTPEAAPGEEKKEAEAPSAEQGRFGGMARLLAGLARSTGVLGDATVRQDLVRLHTLNEIGRINNLRVKAAKQAGRDLPGMGNLAKLSMSDVVRLQRDLGLRIAGPAGMLHSYDGDGADDIVEATGLRRLGTVTELALFAQAPPIYGGTDQVQRNIIGERVLGLPKEPNDDRSTPFRDLPKNA